MSKSVAELEEQLAKALRDLQVTEMALEKVSEEFVEFKRQIRASIDQFERKS